MYVALAFPKNSAERMNIFMWIFSHIQLLINCYQKVYFPTSGNPPSSPNLTLASKHLNLKNDESLWIFFLILILIYCWEMLYFVNSLISLGHHLRNSKFSLLSFLLIRLLFVVPSALLEIGSIFLIHIFSLCFSVPLLC